MFSKVKTLGAALALVMALSAVTASAASAVNHHFEGTKGDKITAQASTQLIYEDTTGASADLNNVCQEVSANAEVEESTQTSLTLAFNLVNCEAYQEGEKQAVMNFRMNGCHFKFTGETTSGNPTEGEHANMHLQCPEGKVMETRVTELELKCSLIVEQEIPHSVRYENEATGGGSEHVLVTLTAHGINAITESVACGEGEHTNGSLTGNVILSAPNGLRGSTTEE